MKAKEAFEIALYKKSLSQINFITEMIRERASRGEFKVLIRLEPTEQTKEHLEKAGFILQFPKLGPSIDFHFFVSWDLNQNSNGNEI